LASHLFALLALPCFLFCAYVALRYAGQAPADLFSFRQTQTALTSYWLLREGFRLDYITPVGGYPWSIPFEFPIYQYLVALTTRVTDMPLDAVGRLLSFVFTVACMVPVRSVVRKLGLPSSTTYAFAAIFFSSPLYIYWGRAFMIETAALFFALASLPFFLDLLSGANRVRSAVGFIAFASLGMLQKVTTELPLLGMLVVVYAWRTLRDAPSIREAFRPAKVGSALACFGIPLAIGALWVVHSDAVKAENAFGTQQTSQALAAWNWGTPAQRISDELFDNVIWRVFEENLAGVFGVLAFVGGLATLANNRYHARTLVGLCLFAGMLPFFLFTNLHVVHAYYQTANVIFLMFGLAVIAAVTAQKGARSTAIVMFGLCILVVSNVAAYERTYAPFVALRFNKFNRTTLALAEVLRRELSETQSFVAFGFEWNSALTYFAQRKSFTVPLDFRQYDTVLHHPETFIGDTDLGAVAACNLDPESSTIAGVMEWAFARHWSVAKDANGCFVAFPDRPMIAASQRRENPACEGSLDFAGDPFGLTTPPYAHTLLVYGWTMISTAAGTAPDDVYVVLQREGTLGQIRRALRVPRADVKTHFGVPGTADAGFSLIVDTTGLNGKYSVGVIRRVGDAVEHCQWNATVVLGQPPNIAESRRQ